jgi:protein-arginine kinase activator protein McsA
VKVLRRLARELRAKLPVDPLEQLQTRLQKAIKAERYEEAARLRDEINRRTASAE